MSNQSTKKKFDVASGVEGRDMDLLKNWLIKSINESFQKLEDVVNCITEDEKYSFTISTNDYALFKKKIYAILDEDYQVHREIQDVLMEHSDPLPLGPSESPAEYTIYKVLTIKSIALLRILRIKTVSPG